MNSGPTGPVKPWLDRMLEIAITLVVIGLLLDWAVSLIRPILPAIITTTVIIITIGMIITVVRRRRNSW